MPRLALGIVLSCVMSARAAAEPGGDVMLGAFRPAMDARGYASVNASQVLGAGELSFGLGALDWAHGVLALDGHGARYEIDEMISATLVGAVGVRLGVPLELGVSLPLRIMSGAASTGAAASRAFDGQGLGAVGLHLKLPLLRAIRHRPGVSVIASAWAPTTSPRGRFLDEASWVPQLIGVADVSAGRLRVAVNGGVRLRARARFVDAAGEVSAGNELPFGAAIGYAVARQRIEVIGEVIGALPLGRHPGYRPLEALASVKVYLARNSYLSLGVGRGLRDGPDARALIAIVFEPKLGDRDGDGIPDDVDRCPREPEDLDGFEDEDGCPDPDNDRDGIPDVDDRCPDIPETRNGFEDEDGCPDGVAGDRDGDGIPDRIDACPDQPEDLDGFEDADGCPDPDNDRDGILDVDDLCPDQPEDKDGFEDADGCPDLDNDHDRIPDVDDRCPDQPETYNNVEDADGCPDTGLTSRDPDGDILILQPIQFEYDSAVIKRASYAILDAVVATMNGYPDIALIEVQGHTDERGDDAYNLSLSERRAAAVVRYLVDHGVASTRLTSAGYGETQPLDKRHLEVAWRKNRRVDFVLKKSKD